jgi:hypothetical protein
MFDGARYYYYLELNESEASAQAAQFVVLSQYRGSNGNLIPGAAPANIGSNSAGLGYKTAAYNVKLERLAATVAGVGAQATTVAATTVSPQGVFTYSWVAYANWDNSENFKLYKGVSRDTAIDGYGFIMNIRPVSCERSSTLDISMSNTSLIGYQDNGAPRTSKSEMSTKVLVSNSGNEFVIGGLEKKSIVTSVDKVPWFGDLPVLGWLLGSESPTTKKSQLVAVIQCTPVQPDTKTPDEIRKEVEQMTAKVVPAGDTFKMDQVGYDQYLFDSDKKGLDPLP